MNEERALKLSQREEIYKFWNSMNRMKRYRFPVRVIVDNSAWWANLKTWNHPTAHLITLLPGQLN